MLSDLLHYLCPTVFAGIGLHLVFQKSNVAVAALYGLILAAASHFLSLLLSNGEFVLDALLYGSLGSVLGFTVTDLFRTHQPNALRVIGVTVSLLIYIGVALLLIVDGGSATGRLTFAESTPLEVLWVGDEPMSANKAAYFEASGTYDYSFSESASDTVDFSAMSFEDLDTLAKAAIANCSNMHVRALSARTLRPMQISVQDDTSTLYYAAELNGAPVSGTELIVILNTDGTLHRVRSTSEFDFYEVGKVRIVSVQKALQEVRKGKRSYTLFGGGQHIQADNAELRYFSNVDTGYYLPYWQVSGTNEFGESIVLRIDAMH